MPRQRSFLQQGRRFLADAFSRDVSDAEDLVNAKTTRTFELTVTSITGDVAEDIRALVFTVLDGQQEPYRLPFRKPIGPGEDPLQDPLLFHVPETNATLVVEAVAFDESGNDRCVGWAQRNLNSNGDVSATVQLKRGSSALLYANVKAAEEPQVATVLLNLHSPKQPRTLLSVHIPPCVIVKKSFIDLSQDVHKFRVKISDIKLAQVSGVRAVDMQQAKYDACAMIHNSYRVLQRQDVPFKVQSGGLATSDINLSFKDLPLLPMTTLVLVVRQELASSSTKTTVGVAAFRLCADPHAVADEDVIVERVPLLGGPFSCEEARWCVAKAEGEWFSPTSFSTSFKLAYTDTYNAAPRKNIATGEVVGLRHGPHAQQQAMQSSVRAGAADMQKTQGAAPRKLVPGTVPAEVKEGVQPVGDADDDQAAQSQKQPAAAGTQGGQIVAATPDAVAADSAAQSHSTRPVTTQGGRREVIIETPVVPEEIHETQKDMYRLLKELADEVHAVKQQLTVPGATSLTPGETIPTRGPDGNIAGDGAVLDIMDAPTRQTRISPAARSSMLRGVRDFAHPLTNARLDPDAALTTRTFAATALAIRFDGVTVPRSRGSQFPPRLDVRVNFGQDPEANITNTKLMLAGEDSTLGQTFALIHDEARGVMWQEKIDPDASPAQVEFLSRYKQGKGAIHIQLFDTLSQFYVASATVPLKHFARPRNAKHTMPAFDLPLMWDTSIAAANAASAVQGFHPLVTEYGTLHVTLCALGYDLAVQQHQQQQVKAMHADAAASSGNGGATRVIEVPKLRPDYDATLASANSEPLKTVDGNVGAADGKPRDATTTPADTAAKQQQLQHMSPDRQQLHLLRAMHVKRAIQSGAIARVTGTTADKAATGGADRIELDLRMKLVEKRREELKRESIAAKLRSRLSISHDVTLARGVPAEVRSVFVNPFNNTIAFRLEFVAASGEVKLRAAKRFGTEFVLGPKEETTVPVIATHDSPATGLSAPVECNILTEKGELIKVITVRPTLAKPVINRRQTIVGEPGSEQVRSFFVRNFTTDILGTDAMPLAELKTVMSNLCTYPKANAATVQAHCRPNADPFAKGCVCAWETAEITARVPTSGTDTVLLHLFLTEGCEAHYETWELTIGPCTTLEAPDVYYGETSKRILPIVCESVFAFSGACRAETITDASGASMVRLTIKPLETGRQHVLIHAFNAGVMSRYSCTFVAAFPQPTHVCNVELGPDDCLGETYRRFDVNNRTDSVHTFSLRNNYEHVARLSDRVVENLAPGDRKYVRLILRGLRPGVNGPMKYPIFIFVNDEEDKTVESLFFDVTVNPSQITAA